MTEGESTRGLRRLWRWLGLIAAVGVVMVAAGVAALQLPAVQRGLFDRAVMEIEARTGLRLAAESVRLRSFGGGVELTGPTVAAGEAQPFLIAESLRVELAIESLFRGPLVLREVVLAAPRLDGARPLPDLAGGANETTGSMPVSVESLQVRRGAVAGFDLPGSLRPYLGAVSAEGLEADGELVDGQLRLSWRVSHLQAEPDGAPVLAVALKGGMAGPMEGPLRLEGLVLDGEALSARATGQLGTDADQPLAVEFELEADVPRLLGVEAVGEPVRVAGQLDLRTMSGELRLDAASVPGELARPWLEAELFEQAALAGSRLRLAGDLSLAGGEFAGVGEASWIRGQEVVAEAALTTSGDVTAEQIPLDLELEILPRASGNRSLEARLLLPREIPTEAQVERGRMRLALPDLERGLTELRLLWPEWLPELASGLAAGPLHASGRFQGGIEDLAVQIDGEWTPASGAAVRLHADASPLARRLDGRIVLEQLPLRRFVEQGRGSLDGSAEVRLAGERFDGQLQVEGHGLGQGDLEVDQVRLAAEVSGRRVVVRELTAEEGGRSFRAGGEIVLGGVPAADIGFEMVGGFGPMTAAEGTLRLDEGRLRVEVPRAQVQGVVASLSATVPLATLARVPGAEALAGLPLSGAEGPVEVEWVQPAIEWGTVLAVDGAGDAEQAARWLAGSRGRLLLDPWSLATAEGEVEISALLVEQGGHVLRPRRPLALTVSAGRLDLASATIEVDDHQVELSGEARLRSEWSPRRPLGELVEEARLGAHMAAAEPLEKVHLDLLLRQGNVELAIEALLRDGSLGRLEGSTPLAALAENGAGTVALEWELPAADWSGWLEGSGDEERALTGLVASSRGRLEADIRQPALATGELHIPRLEVEIGEQSLRTQTPIELRLADGRLAVESARLLASGAPLELSGWIDLEPSWRPDAPAPELLRGLSLTGGGVLPAALLNPFLAGGVGEGTLLAEMEVAGQRDAVSAQVRLNGAGAGFYFVSPYSLEVAAPELTLRVEEGAATFEGAARLNEGRLSFSGEADSENGVVLDVRLDAVRALLDYGLLTLLDGDLRLTLEPDRTGLLAGRLTVDSGQLTRPIRLDSLLLDQLLPADLLGTELDPLEGIALDLSFETRQGVRVKNNLADLKVRWEPLAVRGDLVRPIIEGRLETDPGGLVYAYGQTVRLDSAAAIYRGLPEEVPTLELQTTTSFEDPSIGRLAGNDTFAEERFEPEDDTDEGAGAGAVAGEALTTGLASFLGEQFSRTVGEALGGTRITFRPLLIFGEADPGARLTVSSDLSARATLAASVDLRNAERQTYLLDLHDEQAASRFSAQLFTNDLGNQGGTLQQRLDFGGVRRQTEGPRLRRLNIDRVPGVRRRAMKRAVGYRKGDRLASGAAFEIAVAVGDLLRNRGYPDARVRLEEEPAPRRPGVALAVRVDSGPRVEYEFTGEELPKSLRRVVAQLYRGDFYESAAIEEMRLEAVRAWRSKGYLDPRVTIAREQLSDGPPEQRRVTVDSQPGERLDLEAPHFVGLPAAESAELASLFGGTLRRVELAAGLEGAERRALLGLAALGYPEAVIAGRELSPDGRRLTVRVEAGERLTVAALEFVDSSGLRTEVGEAGGVSAGEAMRADRLTRAALEVETELRQAGYLDAEVTLRVEPLGPEWPFERKAVFALDRGPIYRLAATEFEGLGATRPAWARRTAGLVEGDPLAPTELREARRRLYGTGLFSVVGSGVGAVAGGGAQVLFDVEEQSRYRLAYGLRWESEEGTSLVVDALDRNSFGRGIDLGLRSLWSDEVQQLRLSGSIPGVLGAKSRLELFALAGEEEKLVEGGEILDQTRTVEGTVQLGWQFGPRTTGRIYGRYRDVRFTETFLVEDPFFGPLDPIEVRVRQPFIGLQYIYDSRDDRVVPGRGLFGSLDLSYSDESLGGDIRYGRLFGQLHSFRPVGRLAGRRLTWAQSVRLGRAEAFSGQELLGDLLLRAGGEHSVRGYRRESLGPPALTGTVLPSIADNSLLVLNQELRFDIWDLLSGLIFFDAGNVWIDEDIDFDLFTSLGLGLRADTPFGLLRLDLALPLDQREGIDPDVKLYFGLGNAF